MNLFISAGEASGDAYGAELLGRIRKAVPDLSASAIGGARLSEEGAAMVALSSRWGAISITESFKVGPRVLVGFLKAKSFLRRQKPGLFLPIDFGFVNVKLAAAAKASGWQVLYFIPPGSWRKDRQGAAIPKITDQVVTPFKWSQEILTSMGATAHYFGHPLVDMTSAEPEPESRTGLAILPGSRIHEIRNNMEVIARAVRGRGQTIRFGVARTVTAKQLEAEWTKLGGPAAEFSSDVYRVLKSSLAAVVCSGTATLESALCGCPTVVIYRLNPMMRFEAKLLKPKFDYIALPNILLGRGAMPELIDLDAEPDRIWEEVEPLLTATPQRLEQLHSIREIRGVVGAPGCLDKTAALAAQMLALS